MEAVLYEEIKDIIENWNAPDDIYAVSFLVYPNEEHAYGQYSNLPLFSISYNTEDACQNAPLFSEERWNYAFWLQNDTPVIEYDTPHNADLLIEWLEAQNIADIGYEAEDCYDENMLYIGKGPGGTYELTMLAGELGKKLHEDHILEEKFGKDLPVIIHDLEYSWYTVEATQAANPNGQADDFLEYIKSAEF